MQEGKQRGFSKCLLGHDSRPGERDLDEGMPPCFDNGELDATYGAADSLVTDVLGAHGV